MRLNTKFLTFKGEYARTFSGLGTFEPGRTYQVDDEEKANKMLELKLTDEEGIEVSLFIEEPAERTAALYEEKARRETGNKKAGIDKEIAGLKARIALMEKEKKQADIDLAVKLEKLAGIKEKPEEITKEADNIGDTGDSKHSSGGS